MIPGRARLILAAIAGLCATRRTENTRRSPRLAMRQVVAEFYLGDDTRLDAAPEKRRRADLRLVRQLADIYVSGE